MTIVGYVSVLFLFSQFDDLLQFRRYHASEIRENGRSRINAGWWAGAREVNVEGRSLLLLPYGFGIGSAKVWNFFNIFV